MLKNISGQNRTLRSEVSPKLLEQKALYETMAQGAIFRAYPCMKNLSVEIQTFFFILLVGTQCPKKTDLETILSLGLVIIKKNHSPK